MNSHEYVWNREAGTVALIRIYRNFCVVTQLVELRGNVKGYWFKSSPHSTKTKKPRNAYKPCCNVPGKDSSFSQFSIKEKIKVNTLSHSKQPHIEQIL